MAAMQLLPAIDMIDGQCVRLVRGDYAQKTVFAADPVAKAKEFAAAGADSIHLVDLDGAKAGRPLNDATIRAIKAETDLFAEVGGGIRTLKDLEMYVEAGLDRVILGTSALRDRDFLKTALRSFGEKVAVGIDAKDGDVAVAGWTEKSEIAAVDFAQDVAELGAKTIIYTDISRDGMLQGPNLTAMTAMAQAVPAVKVIASGGVTKIADVSALAATGVGGCIIGKAIYTGDITYAELWGEKS